MIYKYQEKIKMKKCIVLNNCLFYGLPFKLDITV